MTSTMSSAWNFVKNHKKTIFFSVSAVAGFIGLRKYISNFERQWEQSQSRNFVSEVHKKGTYFDEALCIGNDMVNKQYAQVVKKIKDLFKIEAILQQIQEAKANNMSPQEMLTYFEELKLEIFTYIISEVYAITFFIVYLRIQLSMISGVMYFENQTNAGSSESTTLLKDSSSRYHMFISLIENFHLNGVDHIVNALRESVRLSFGSVSVTEKVTLKNVLNVMNEIKVNVSSTLESMIERNAALVFTTNSEQTIPEELNSRSKIVTELKAYQKLVDETGDIVKLSDFRKVVESCLNIGYSNLFDFISECFLQFDEQNQCGVSGASGERRQFINPHQITIPLLKLLPLIWTQVSSTKDESNSPQMHEFTDKPKNRNALLVQYLLCSDNLTCFTANIYEAFCNENDKIN